MALSDEQKDVQKNAADRILEEFRLRVFLDNPSVREMQGPVFLTKSANMQLHDRRIAAQQKRRNVTYDIWALQTSLYDTRHAGPYHLIRLLLDYHGLDKNTVVSNRMLVPRMEGICQVFFGCPDVAARERWFVHDDAPEDCVSGDPVRGPCIILPPMMTSLMYWFVAFDDTLNALAEARILANREAEAAEWRSVDECLTVLDRATAGNHRAELKDTTRAMLDALLPPPARA